MSLKAPLISVAILSGAFLLYPAPGLDGYEARIAIFCVFFAGVCLLVYEIWCRLMADDSDSSRGRRQVSQHEAANRVAKATERVTSTNSDPRPEKVAHSSRGFSWGGVNLPLDAATTHFFLLGASGSGKSVTIKNLMCDILPEASQPGLRAVVFDVKNEMPAFLNHMGFPPYVTLNPFDARGVGWDIAADVTEKDVAESLAEILIPVEKEDRQRHFPETAQLLLSGVMRSFFLHAPGNWSFRDLVHATRNRSRLQEVLSLTQQGKDIVEQHFREHSGLNSVLSTLDTKMSRYETVASSWAQATANLSLSRWVNGEGPPILVIPRMRTKRAQLDPINRALLTRLGDLLLAEDQPQTKTPRTFFFLDEAREAGKIGSLSTLLNDGRSFGVSVVLGTQTIEGLHEVYGKNGAQELTANCTNKSFFRLESTESAKWAEQTIGQREFDETSYGFSETSSSQGIQHSYQENVSRVTRPTVMAEDLLTLFETNAKNGLTGYYLTGPIREVWSAHTPIEEFPPEVPKEALERHPNFLKRIVSEADFSWSEADRKRLGLDSQGSQETPITLHFKESEETKLPWLRDEQEGGRE